MINNNRCTVLSVHPQGLPELCPQMLLNLLDCLPCGVALLDATGAVQCINNKLMRMLDARDGLCLDGKRICAQRQPDAAALKDYLDTVEHGSSRSLLAIPRPSGRMPYLLRRQSLVVGQMEVMPAASDIQGLLFVTDPEEKLLLQPQVLKQIFDLTPKEAELASRLCQGVGLTEAASLMGIARATVRRHLEHVFRKCDVSSQSELIALLMASLAPLGPVESLQRISLPLELNSTNGICMTAIGHLPQSEKLTPGTEVAVQAIDLQ